MGKKVKFKFRLKADQGTEFDGYFFDDFNISMLLDPTGIQKSDNTGAFLGNPYPNPAANHFEVSYFLPHTNTDAELLLNTPAGVVVSHTKLTQQSGNAAINISNLAPGIYFVSIRSAGIQSPVRKLVVK
jgi:hypothetical protein